MRVLSPWAERRMTREKQVRYSCWKQGIFAWHLLRLWTQRNVFNLNQIEPDEFGSHHRPGGHASSQTFGNIFLKENTLCYCIIGIISCIIELVLYIIDVTQTITPVLEYENGTSAGQTETKADPQVELLATPAVIQGALVGISFSFINLGTISSITYMLGYTSCWNRCP